MKVLGGETKKIDQERGVCLARDFIIEVLKQNMNIWHIFV